MNNLRGERERERQSAFTSFSYYLLSVPFVQRITFTLILHFKTSEGNQAKGLSAGGVKRRNGRWPSSSCPLLTLFPLLLFNGLLTSFASPSSECEQSE